MTAIEGSYDGNVLGYLGSVAYGAYDQLTTTRFGYLGSASYGAYGQYDANHYGFMGAGTVGVFGGNSNGTNTNEWAVQGQITGSTAGSTNKYAGWFQNTSSLAINQYGAYGEVSGATGTGSKYGIYGTATGTGTVNYGIYGTASGATANWAGYFAGDIKTTGKLYILETGSAPQYNTIFQAGDQAADLTYTLPPIYPTANGQVLSSTTAGVMSWTTVSAGSSAISDLTAATTANTIDNLNLAQVWNWNTATSQDPMTIASTSLTT